jgi:hypothetical protein
MSANRYLLANAASQAGDRFAALSAMFDPVTFAHIDAVGIGAGWRCWEVGAGGMSVPRWMAGKAGGTGQVLTTDIDVSWLQDVGAGVESTSSMAASFPACCATAASRRSPRTPTLRSPTRRAGCSRRPTRPRSPTRWWKAGGPRAPRSTTTSPRSAGANWTSPRHR